MHIHDIITVYNRTTISGALPRAYRTSFDRIEYYHKTCSHISSSKTISGRSNFDKKKKKMKNDACINKYDCGRHLLVMF